MHDQQDGLIPSAVWGGRWSAGAEAQHMHVTRGEVEPGTENGTASSVSRDGPAACSSTRGLLRLLQARWTANDGFLMLTIEVLSCT